MRKYIALLRGVNVGGKNKVPMPVLKAIFEEAGFCSVRTYINSGNIIFSCEECDILALQQKCRQIIMNKFELDIDVAVFSSKDVLDAINNAPKWWDNDDESKHNAIFVIPPVTVQEVIKQVGAIKPEYERVSFFGQVIFWSAQLKTFSRTSWSKLVLTPAYSRTTIRNANTAKKLAQLADDKPEDHLKS